MKLKTVEIEGKQYAEVQEGKPVFVEDDGKEIAFDAPGTRATISRLNAEAKTHREAKEEAQAALKSFEGIEDPEAARKALSITKNLDDKKLVDAGEVERVKAEAIKAVEEKYSPTLKENETLKEQLSNHLIGGAFSSSKYIAENFAAEGPAGVEIARALFSNAFKVKDGKVVAHDSSGNELYSRARPGEIASADEAIELLVDAYPHKNHILKGTGANGSGANPGGGGGGEKTVDRKGFDAMGASERSAFIKDGGKVTD